MLFIISIWNYIYIFVSVENLQKNHIKAHYMNFPNRQSDTGKVINSYLTSKVILEIIIILLINLK